MIDQATPLLIVLAAFLILAFAYQFAVLHLERRPRKRQQPPVGTEVAHPLPEVKERPLNWAEWFEEEQ